MKKLITIILALIMTLFSAPQKCADQPHVTAEKQLQTAITTTVEQVPEESEKSAETAFVGEVTEAETTAEVPKKEAPTVQEQVTEECTEVAEENVIMAAMISVSTRRPSFVSGAGRFCCPQIL